MPKQATNLYQLKISLVDSKPPIWRRIIVRSDIGLPKLHRVLQIVMGWDNAHLHAFRTNDEIYGEPEDHMAYMKNETQFKLMDLLQREKDSLIYEYDFGDSWEHKVLLEKILPYDETIKNPECIKGKLACPPEDCGGIWGYYELLETLADPNHPDHDGMLEWLGEEFDPQAFDMTEINKLLAKVAD